MSTNPTDSSDVITRFWRNAEAPAEPEGPVVIVPADSLGRRRFLQILGTAIAIPSLAACTRQPKEEIIPYVKQPEQIVPGRPLFYATATLLGGFATGVLVEQQMGRPIKVEGNPEHPASLGGTDAFMQAEILQLYDPDRSQTAQHNGEISSWGELVSALQVAALARRSVRGAGLHIVTGELTSPTLIGQMDALLREMPSARWYVHEAAGSDADLAGTKAAFGRPYEARYRFDQADVVLSLDADFLGSAEGNPRYVRDYARRRGEGARGAAMNRLYALHSAPQLTAAAADHRLGMGASQVEHVARALVAKVFDRLGRGEEAKAIGRGVKLPQGATEAWIDAVAEDLAAAGKRALLVPGKYQPAIVHRLSHAANHALSAVGSTVSYAEPVRASARGDVRGLDDLIAALGKGEVELLLVLGTNPVYSRPAFARHIMGAKLRVHHGLYFDETAALCHWHVPATHPFESWSDGRSFDGTLTIVQPLIEPLYQGKSEHELLAALSNKPDRTGYTIVREAWKPRVSSSAGAFGLAFRRVLHEGFLAGSESHAAEVLDAKSEWPEAPPASDELEVIFRPDLGTYDGRYANNAWLQEMPKPLTQLTWDNALLMSPSTAKARGLENGDVVRLDLGAPAPAGERGVEAPVWILPGHPIGSVTVTLGYGRERGGKVARGAGFNAYRLFGAAWHEGKLRLEKTGKQYPLVTAQPHGSMEGRDLAKSATLATYREDPKCFAEHDAHEPLSMYPPHEYKGYAWGMTIDLTSCIGCSACLVACQAENNVPVVGKEEVQMGREMHWIRIDRYFEGDQAAPDTRFQPVPCMHCEVAPCEAVCPVQATVHHDEGLNDMVYNRCVGTKDCSANCPYKVRRFNFFAYGVEAVAPLDPKAPSMRMLHNPDVTVRSYGVMEKCSYCVQRINQARVTAKREDRHIRDGDVMSACQAACPARAISFGDVNDAKSEVSRRKAEARNYTLLPELNTKPRTSYLARITNPNPRLLNGERGGHG